MVVITIRQPTVKLTNEEKEQWDKLYQYVKQDILQYDNNQSIPKNLILRLKGLKNGKLMANKSTSGNANYTYEVILIAFKMCKTKILNAVYGKSFKNEMSKFMYICAIVESEINDVYLRLQTARKVQERVESISTNNIEHEGADYQSKTVDTKTNKNLEKIW